ncbi:MAG TPA: zinc-finger domain-containing protein [Gammaproteobacteria bacterium]|nr:zinc-finger domain-containing protein [Gammaproteobacteria bacterium]
MGTSDRPGTNPTSVTRQMTVTGGDLPLHCPTREMSLWNAHPRVFLPIEETGHARCPYCGTEFTLRP